MKKSILIILFAIFASIANANAQIIITPDLDLDLSSGSKDITAYPNSVVYPGNYELNMLLSVMVNTPHSGKFYVACHKRMRMWNNATQSYGAWDTWGTFVPNLTFFPNLGPGQPVASLYSGIAKTTQYEGSQIEYYIRVTFVRTDGATVIQNTPTRTATVLGVPTACFSMYNVNSTANEPSLYGSMPVKTICQNAVTISGSCSKFEKGYHVRISEFNLATWSFIGADIYNNWVSATGEAPSFISLNALAASNGKVLTPGKLYLVCLSVGPVWNSAPPQFFRVVTCRNSGGDVDQLLEEVPSEVVLDDVAVKPESLQLSPNPVQNDLTFTIADGEKILSYAIFDNTGNEVVKKAFTGDSNTQTIDLSDLRKGFYIINVESDKMVYKEKLIKE